MKRVTEYRANKILFNFIKSNHVCGKVLLPTNVCSSVVDTLLAADMELLFADIAADTLCLDTSIIFERVKNVSVLLYVHTYGVETDVTELFHNVREINPNIVIIDDKCLCLPEWNVEYSLANIVLYSTGAKKQVSLKEGGIGFVSDKWLYKECQSSLFETKSFTIKSSKLRHEEDNAIEHKEKLNDIYRTHLPKHIQFPERFQHWRFNIWVGNKEQVLQALVDNGLFASGHYKPQTQDCPIAQKLYDHVINLFNDQYYTEQQALKTCEIINQQIGYGI